MTHYSKWNGFQYLGLIVALFGILLIAFPNAIGVFSIRVITFIFMSFAVGGVVFSSQLKSTVSLVVSVLALLLSFYAFANPSSLLFVIGMIMIASGFNGLYLYFSRMKNEKFQTIISSIILIPLGAFAIINAKAALSTIVIIAGIITTVIGVVLFITGHNITTIFNNKHTYWKPSSRASQSTSKSGSSRVVINIQSDEVEEVDFKEVH